MGVEVRYVMKKYGLELKVVSSYKGNIERSFKGLKMRIIKRYENVVGYILCNKNKRKCVI